MLHVLQVEEQELAICSGRRSINKNTTIKDKEESRAEGNMIVGIGPDGDGGPNLSYCRDGDVMDAVQIDEDTGMPAFYLQFNLQ